MLFIQSLYIVRKMHKVNSSSNSESSTDSRFSNGWEYFDVGGEETIKKKLKGFSHLISIPNIRNIMI